jgi:hypothetical protein
MRIDGYWIEAIGNGFGSVRFTLPPFPPGTNVYATISLSMVADVFSDKEPDPTFDASAFIADWTFYKADGTIGSDVGNGFSQNAVGIENCETISFNVTAERAVVYAQINVFSS